MIPGQGTKIPQATQHGQKKKIIIIRISLVVQCLRLHAFNAGDTGFILGWRTRIPHATGCSQKKKKKRIYYKAYTFLFLEIKVIHFFKRCKFRKSRIQLSEVSEDKGMS